MNKINRKSQVEILGLAIVVVLVIMGMLFVIKFVAFKQPTDYRGEVVQSQTVSNYISTFLRVTFDECDGLSATELLQDCAQTGTLCGGSCFKIGSSAQYLFGQTFEAQKIDYKFTAYIDGNENEPEVEIGPGCPGERRTALYPLPSGTNILYLRLDIC